MYSLTTNRHAATKWLLRRDAKRAVDAASDELPQNGLKFTIMQRASRFYVLCAGDDMAGFLKEAD